MWRVCLKVVDPASEWAGGQRPVFHQIPHSIPIGNRAFLVACARQHEATAAVEWTTAFAQRLQPVRSICPRSVCAKNDTHANIRKDGPTLPTRLGIPLVGVSAETKEEQGQSSIRLLILLKHPVHLSSLRIYRSLV